MLQSEHHRGRASRGLPAGGGIWLHHGGAQTRWCWQDLALGTLAEPDYVPTAPKSYFSFGKGAAKAGPQPLTLFWGGGIETHPGAAGRPPPASPGAAVAAGALGPMGFGWGGEQIGRRRREAAGAIAKHTSPLCPNSAGFYIPPPLLSSSRRAAGKGMEDFPWSPPAHPFGLPPLLRQQLKCGDNKPAAAPCISFSWLATNSVCDHSPN